MMTISVILLVLSSVNLAALIVSTIGKVIDKRKRVDDELLGNIARGLAEGIKKSMEDDNGKNHTA